MTTFAWHTGPLPSLEKAIEEAKSEGWFKAIILSAINLEHYGYLKLKDHMDTLKLQYRSEDLENLNLPSIALLLYTLGKIGKTEYDTMVKINSIRNKVIHRRQKRKILLGRAADKEFQPLVEDTVRILREYLNAIKIVFTKK